MTPACFYRTLPLLGSRPSDRWNDSGLVVRPFHPYQPSDWGALQRYARPSLVAWQWVPWCSADTLKSTGLVEWVWP